MMNRLLFNGLLVMLIVGIGYSQTTDKYTDGNRPYEFGFNIEGQQHRHEAKDKQGLITGEFGFITADGVYHVTVYATDEEGRFKILSMKSIKVSPPLDGSGDQTPISPGGLKPLVSGPISNGLATPPPRPVPKPPGGLFTTAKPLPVASCSSCAIPSTTLGPPGSDPNKFIFQTPAFQNPNNRPNENHNNIPGVHPDPFNGGNPFNPPGGIHKPAQDLIGPLNPHEKPFNPPRIPGNNDLFDRPISIGNPNIPESSPSIPDSNINPTIPGFPSNPNFPPHKQPPGNPNFPPHKQPPATTTHIPDDAFFPGVIHRPADPATQTDPPLIQGELPPGVTVDDMLNLLYRFNYTVGFHGHYETGYRNGAKIGGYFINGRDGISRIVEYVADEKGYRPKITFVNLGLDSPDTPKEDTEKNYGLKGQIFEWFSLR